VGIAKAGAKPGWPKMARLARCKRLARPAGSPTGAAKYNFYQHKRCLQLHLQANHFYFWYYSN
jgi:hypothetical protein